MNPNINAIHNPINENALKLKEVGKNNLLERKKEIDNDIEAINTQLQTKYSCPICGEIFSNPFSIGDGRIYDYECIKTRLGIEKSFVNNEPQIDPSIPFIPEEKTRCILKNYINRLNELHSELNEIDLKLKQIN